MARVEQKLADLGIVLPTPAAPEPQQAATAASGSREKSARRGEGTHSVRVPAEMIGCIE